MKSFIEWLNSLGIHDPEDLGLFVLKGFFVLAITFWIGVILGFILVGNGLSPLWAPVIVFVIFITSFLISVFVVYIGKTDSMF